MHTGDNAVAQGQRFGQGHLATDIETPGLDRAFEINCVTMAWEQGGDTHSILLDPCRNQGHHALVCDMYDRASMIILHNAMFDVPALYHHKMLTMTHIRKIVDTLVLARYGWPDPMVRKSLSHLAKAHLGMDENAEGMKMAFKAAGFKTIQAGYEGMDIDSPIYRQGAMLDTIATLRLQPILREHCWAWSLKHPFVHFGATSHGEAEALLETQEKVNRVMLRRTARGINVDRDYLNVYAESINVERLLAEAELATHGLEGGAGKGKKIVDYLDALGELPHGWPRTPTGGLRATKADLDALDHPLASAQRTLAEMDKITGYIRKVDHQASVTGRCHPQVGILGASATGRMAASMPEYQQFSGKARPIFTSDGEPGDDRQLWSIDWAQIEPVTMGLMAKDEKFLLPFEQGADLYEPIQRAAGIDRPTAKVVLLATMYGQGDRGMAAKINQSQEAAAQIRRQMLAAMPECKRWMVKVQSIAEQHGLVITAGGRILPVDSGGVFRAVNYIVQGSAYDFLAHTICQMEAEGLGDTVVLGMHDELVIDATTEQAERVEQIMLTPPEWIVKWAERVPTLRCDREPMGKAWAKV